MWASYGWGRETPVEAQADIDAPYCLALPQGRALTRGEGQLELSLASQEIFVSCSRHHHSDNFNQTSSLRGYFGQTSGTVGQFAGVLPMVTYGLGVTIMPASCFTVPHLEIRVCQLSRSRYGSG